MFVLISTGTVLYESPNSSSVIDALIPFGVGQLYKVMLDMALEVENKARDGERDGELNGERQS